MRVKRRRKVVAKMIPVKRKEPAWKLKALRLKISGGALSQAILEERGENLI